MDTNLLFRLVFSLIFVASVMISGYHRRKARLTSGTIPRTDEGKTVLALRMVLMLPLLVSFALFIFAPQWLSWSQFNGPNWLRGLASGIAALCLPLLWSVFHNIRGNISETVLTKKNHQLVTSGPYRRVRHPLYALSLTLLAALGLVASNWFILCYVLFGVLVFRIVVIPREEKNLIDAFGAEYEAYRQRSGALIPRIG